MDKETNASIGSGIVGMLTLLFILLRLMGVINWSWWLVLSPILLTVVLLIFLVITIVVIYQMAE